MDRERFEWLVARAADSLHEEFRTKLATFGSSSSGTSISGASDSMVKMDVAVLVPSVAVLPLCAFC